MLRSIALTLAVASVLVVTPAFADSGRHEGAGAAGRVAHEHERSFPMKGAEFKAKVDRRIARARARLDEGLVRHKVDEAKAKEIRSRFDAGVAKLQEEVKKVTADDVVTKEEAKGVRELARSLRPHEGEHGEGKGRGAR
ncbi:MAG: hypothetical protein U0169_18100 [Polyangiaceae bacterium]